MDINQLREAEGRLIECSTRLWQLTVADPDTATVESEAAEAAADTDVVDIRAAAREVHRLAEGIEVWINDRLAAKEVL